MSRYAEFYKGFDEKEYINTEAIDNGIEVENDIESNEKSLWNNADLLALMMSEFTEANMI